MSLRHVLGAGLAVVLTAGPALALSAVPAQAAAKPHYVAVVISGHGTYCVKWRSGITGDTVLNDVASVNYRSDGIVLQIDGAPSSGKADDSHYWSYWHDTSGKRWAYSNFGASGYDPEPGSVEGWSYDNGKASAPSPSQKPSGLYAKLCGARDRSGGTVVVPVTSTTASTTATSPTSAARRTTPAARHRSTHTSFAPQPTGRSSDAATTSATPSGTATRTATTPRTTSAAPTRSTTRSASSSATSTAAAAPSSGPTPSAPRTIDASPAASSSSSGSPTGLFVALGLVVVLGAGAGVSALRRRSAGG